MALRRRLERDPTWCRLRVRDGRNGLSVSVWFPPAGRGPTPTREIDVTGVTDVDVIVLGGGTGGLTAAREARRLGASVALVQDGPVGGECTFTGCIPSKALIAAAARGEDFGSAMRAVRRAVAAVAATEDAECCVARASVSWRDEGTSARRAPSRSTVPPSEPDVGSSSPRAPARPSRRSRDCARPRRSRTRTCSRSATRPPRSSCSAAAPSAASSPRRSPASAFASSSSRSRTACSPARNPRPPS